MMICLEAICSQNQELMSGEAAKPKLIASRGSHAILICLEGNSSKSIKVLRVFCKIN